MVSVLKVVSIRVGPVTPDLNQFLNQSPSGVSSHVQYEVDRVGDVMTNRLIWKFDAALQCAGR